VALVTAITGAASGIGKATALRLAGPDRKLGLTTRSNSEGLEAVAVAARNKGAEVVTHLGDLTEPSSAKTFIDVVRNTLGPLDQLVSNAGHAQKKTMAELSQRDIDQAVALNTKPFLSLVQAVRADLETSDFGRVVVVSSFVTQQFGINGTLFPATAASKAALLGLAKSLAVELALKGVTVNAVSPGYTEKEGTRGTLDPEAWHKAADVTPNGRLAKPADIAAAIAFFLSEDAGHITGQVLNVDGGMSLR